MKGLKVRDLLIRSLDYDLLCKIYLKFHKHYHRDLFYHIFKQQGKNYDYYFLKFNFNTDIFLDQINWLRKLDFKAVSFSDFLNNREAYKNRRTFSISTDDGYSENYEVLLPFLEKEKVPCTFYLVNNVIDNKSWIWNDRLFYIENSQNAVSESVKKEIAGKFNLGDSDRFQNLFQWAFHEWPMRLADVISKELWIKSGCPPEAEVLNDLKPYLSSEQVKEIVAAGFEIGAHTCSHYNLARLDYQTAHDEIVESFKRLRENFNCKVQYFAYPYGERIKPDYEAKILKAADAKLFTGIHSDNNNGFGKYFFQRDDVETNLLRSKYNFLLLPLRRQSANYYRRFKNKWSL